MAVLSLFGAMAFVPVVGGIMFSLVLVGLFFLGLVGVLGGSGERTVVQHNPKMNSTGWRDGS